MKAWKLNLVPHLIEVRNEQGEIENKPYEGMIKFIIEMIMGVESPSGYSLIEREELAMKIKNAGDSVLLNETEKKNLQAPFENMPTATIPGSGRVPIFRPGMNEVPIYRRILKELEEVEVEEKEPKKPKDKQEKKDG